MSAAAYPQAEPAREIDVVTLFRLVNRHRLLIALTTAFCVIAAVVFALTATPRYEAEVVVSEVTDEGLADAESLASRLGGLATLAGVDIGAAGQGREARAVLQSRRLIEEFIKRNDLVPQILRESKARPSLWLAVRQFQQHLLTIEEDPLKGTTAVEIEWTEPATAARWANEFVALANELLRTRAIEEARRNIDYLNEQLKRTNVVEMRRVIFNLIERETKTLMLANGRKEYAFRIVDPAVTPEMRASPRRTVIVILGALFGVFLGVLAAFARESWSRHRAAATRPV